MSSAHSPKSKTRFAVPRAIASRALVAGILLSTLFSSLAPGIARGASQVASEPSQSSGNSAASPVPVLAYYYIWFDTTSWDRAKVDYPLLGRYSSSDETVMRQHIRWAKSAGINGFIVSWKSTPTLDARLEKLAAIAGEENFKLVIIYEGLDFNRKPLPVSQIDNDIGYFISHFSNQAPFSLFEKPVVIWSGIWQFSREDVQTVSEHWRNQVLLLATEKNTAGYERVADLVDGNAYYWSSINPETNSGYESKLAGMGKAVHAHHGLWIPPAAPGFDARLVGGTTVVERNNGETLRQQIGVAMQSAPDAVGIISWNEFSENTYIEPSEKFGKRYLDVLANLQNTPGPQILDFDSSEPAETVPQFEQGRIAVLLGIAAIVLGSLAILVKRRLMDR